MIHSYGALFAHFMHGPETISGHARANITNTNQRERVGWGFKLLLFIHFKAKEN
jgi:hypothetical protein